VTAETQSQIYIEYVIKMKTTNSCSASSTRQNDTCHLDLTFYSGQSVGLYNESIK